MYEDRIVIDPAVRHEKPIIKGTRVPLEIIIGSLAGGMEIEETVKEYDIQKIILGLPKNMNNTLGERAEITTKYKRILEENTNIPVIFFDERLTSVISNSILIEADISRKKRKKKVDSIAAQIILQDYLNKEKNEHE